MQGLCVLRRCFLERRDGTGWLAGEEGKKER